MRVDGKLYRVYARTERAAENEVAKLRAKIAGGQVSPPGSETVAQYLDRWLTIQGPRLGPRTVASYRQHIRDHIGPSIGRVRLDRLDPSDVQRMIAGLSKKGLSPATIQRTRGTLRAALAMAMRWGLVVRNVATLVTLPPVRRVEIQPLSPDEIPAFLEAVEWTSVRNRYRGERITLSLIMPVTQGRSVSVEVGTSSQLRSWGNATAILDVRNSRLESISVSPR